MLSSRYVKFTPLVASTKPSVCYLARLVRNDNITLMGRTASKISREINVAKALLTNMSVNKATVYFPVPDDQHWRVDIIKDLLNVRRNLLSLHGITPDYLCST
jgi:hypothetical protein